MGYHEVGYDETTARELAEPEDQDYYGIGSRSARWMIIAVIGILYCQLCPLISLLVLINFFLTKVGFTYLLVFAETRKPDLGGVIFVDQLAHLQAAFMVYVVLMTGVLGLRADAYCAVVAASSLPYLLWSYRRFQKVHWQTLPYELIQQDA